MRRTTGLYHFAILVPSRVELARSLRRLVESETVPRCSLPPAAPDQMALGRVAARVTAAGITLEDVEGRLLVRDPSQNAIVVLAPS